jgi:hypothetical protein
MRKEMNVHNLGSSNGWYDDIRFCSKMKIGRKEIGYHKKNQFLTILLVT